MLYNLALLSNAELQHLFLQESERFMEGIELNATNNSLRQVRMHIKEIVSELQERRKEGRLKDE